MTNCLEKRKLLHVHSSIEAHKFFIYRGCPHVRGGVQMELSYKKVKHINLIIKILRKGTFSMGMPSYLNFVGFQKSTRNMDS